MRSGGVGSGATVVGRGPVTFFSGCLGQCAAAHNLHAMEYPKEMRAVRRALLLPSGGPSIRPLGALLFLLMQKKPAFVPDSEAFNSYIGDGFLVPELKGGSEASEDEQADSSSENNVGNGASFVIGLHRSGDTIARFLQDWEVAKVASLSVVVVLLWWSVCVWCVVVCVSVSV